MGKTARMMSFQTREEKWGTGTVVEWSDGYVMCEVKDYIDVSETR